LRGTAAGFARWQNMPKEPKPGEPRKPPIEEPKPDVQPEQLPPDNPQEDRPLHDPQPPNIDLPRM